MLSLPLLLWSLERGFNLDIWGNYGLQSFARLDVASVITDIFT
jgi:hypothetical protein